MSKKLDGLHPKLVEAVSVTLDGMAKLGYPMMVTDGIRTAEHQNELYAQGRWKPGNIVTHADGYKKKSNHQPKDDGLGHACDCAFVDQDGRPDGRLPAPRRPIRPGSFASDSSRAR